MVDKTRDFLRILFFLVIGFFIGICFKTITYTIEENKENNYSQLPRKVLTATITENQLPIFFTQLNNFADEEKFAIRIDTISPDRNRFRIELWRSDIHILALNSFEKNTFNLYFFDTNPLLTVSPNLILDTVASRLKVNLFKIDDIFISEE
jgi:hypothetical protein